MIIYGSFSIFLHRKLTVWIFISMVILMHTCKGCSRNVHIPPGMAASFLLWVAPYCENLKVVVAPFLKN